MAYTVETVSSHRPPKEQRTAIKLYQNYRTISLISHPSKVMLKIILNRLKPEAKKIIAQDAALQSRSSTSGYSLLQWQHRRLVQNYSRSKTGLSNLTHPLQHIPGENHGWFTWRSQIDSQHWRQYNLKLTFCWWHRRPHRLGIRVSKPSGAPWPDFYRIRHADQCWEYWWPTTPMPSAVTSGSMVRIWKPFKASNIWEP